MHLHRRPQPPPRPLRQSLLRLISPQRHREHRENLNRRWTQIYADGDWEQIAADVERRVMGWQHSGKLNIRSYTDFADFVWASDQSLATESVTSQNFFLSKVTCPSLKAKSA